MYLGVGNDGNWVLDETEEKGRDGTDEKDQTAVNVGDRNHENQRCQ